MFLEYLRHRQQRGFTFFQTFSSNTQKRGSLQVNWELIVARYHCKPLLAQNYH